MVELISLHVPKCAGTSLLEAFYRIYGAQAVHGQYDQLENPLSPFNIDPIGFMERLRNADMSYLAGKRVIHGHFHINRFAGIAGAPRVTILRHPLSRLISHYFFWKHVWNRHKGPLQQYMLDQDLSLAQFARLPNIRYYYTRIFFRDVDMKIFDAVGTFEDLPSSIHRISQLIGREIEVRHENRITDKAYAVGKESVMNDSQQLAVLEDLLRDDIAFYELWAAS